MGRLTKVTKKVTHFFVLNIKNNKNLNSGRPYKKNGQAGYNANAK
jgi:hypothetical protein